MAFSLGDRLTRLRSGYLQRPYTSVQLLLLSGSLLLAFGVMMATSTTISASMHDGNQGSLFAQLIDEAMFLIIGIPIFWIGIRISPRGYRLLAYPMLIIAMILLLAVLVPHIGVTINGAQRWFRFGPIQIQPSEFAKLAMLVWGADLLARKHELCTLTSAKHVMVPLVPGFVVVCLLVMAEPDLGTTLCFVTILMGLLWTVGLPFRYFGAMFAVVAGAVTLLAITEPYRLERLTSFTDPFADKQGSGMQAVQGLYALASGGLFGVGLGSGTSKFGWVPNANTDYVFAVIGEELGLVGCLAVLVAFGLFAYTAVRIAHRSTDTFVRLAATGTAVWLCGQALINIGYVTGLLPVTGIPLPFVSAGGTSLVLTMGVFGMLVSFARHEPEAIAAAQAAAVGGRATGFARVFRLGVPRPIPVRVPKQRPARPAPARTAPRSAPVRTATGRTAPARTATGRTAPAPRSAVPRPAVPRPAVPRPAVPRPAAQRPPAARPVAPAPLRPTGSESRRPR
jgi:cell division protein FtsW